MRIQSAQTRTVKLIALSDAAQRALRASEVSIVRFPFNVGRDSRVVEPRANDVYLVEAENASGRAFHISREHFSIEQRDGAFVLIDRGSACGTTINGQWIGGGRCGGRATLSDDDEIIVGSPASPYVFKFKVV